jgi:hypothetical protein
MKNYLQLEINGQKYGFKFNVGTCNHLKNLTGQDPFKFKAASEDYADFLIWFRAIFQAALLSNHQSKKEQVEYTTEEIDALVNELSVRDINLIAEMYSNPVDSKPSVNGEVTPNTQSGVNVG